MAANESTEQAGLAAAATERGAAAHDAGGAHQHLAIQLPEEELQKHASPEQEGVCDGLQISGMTFQAPRVAGSAATGDPPPNDADESTEHGLVVVVADDTTHDQDGFTEHDAVVLQQQFLDDEHEGEDDGQFLDDEDPQREFLDDEHSMVVAARRRFFEVVHDLPELDGYPYLDIYWIAAAAAQRIRLDGLPSYRNGGFGAVPASAAAVAGLEKRVFHACSDDHGGCAICLEEEFEEGQELSVMPCAKAHAFHTGCISPWLGQSNMCPLCRHALPASEDY